MPVGIQKKIKDNEHRVGIVPSTVRELIDNGHGVLIGREVGAAKDSAMPAIKGARSFPTPTREDS